MKKLVLSLQLLLILISSGYVSGQQYFETSAFNNEYSHLVLTHPTVHNVKTFMNLIRKDLVDLTDTRIVGVFYEHSRYDYQKTREFLDTCDSVKQDILLHKISDSVDVDDLYKENDLSDDFEMIFQHSEGIIFFGGPDMPTQTYGEKTNLLTSIYDPGRHFFELTFLFHLTGGSQDPAYKPLLATDPDYLIYGFCLGMQTMNVAAGGTLVQDIPTEIYGVEYAEDVVKMDENAVHRNYYRHTDMDDALLSGSFHQVDIQNGTFLRKLSDNANPWIYSNHHQCIDELGQNYAVIAHSMDNNIIEAFRHNKYENVIAVQFHPEAMLLYNDDIEFRIQPGDQLQKGKNILEEKNSMKFHKAYWKDFSERFNALN
ncbi:MAG: gamma-glutamyl-gamma-aminobutyrate hydrolase family protein [Bacteroidales bacterium]